VREGAKEDCVAVGSHFCGFKKLSGGEEQRGKKKKTITDSRDRMILNTKKTCTTTREAKERKTPRNAKIRRRFPFSRARKSQAAKIGAAK